MARGKTTPPEKVYQVLLSYATTHSYAETARNLKMPESTVTKIVKDNKDKPEFVELCGEKKIEFAERASQLIDKGMELLERRLSTALDSETELNILIDEIYASDKTELTQDEKNRLVAKIRGLQLQSIGDVVKTVGTLYDKRALSRGEDTENTKIKIVVDYNE